MNVGIVRGGGGGSAPVFMLAAWRLGVGGGGKEMPRGELSSDFQNLGNSNVVLVVVVDSLFNSISIFPFTQALRTFRWAGLGAGGGRHQ